MSNVKSHSNSHDIYNHEFQNDLYISKSETPVPKCNKCYNLILSAPVPLCQSVIKRLDDFSSDETLRVAVGTYNINGGKHFRSVVYKNVSLDDWLIDPHKQNNESRFLFLSGNKVLHYTIKLQPLLTLTNRARMGKKNKLTSMQLDLRRWSTLTPRTS